MLNPVIKNQYYNQLSEVSGVQVPSTSAVHGELTTVNRKIDNILKELGDFKTPVDERELYKKLEEIDKKLKCFDELPDSKFSSNEKRGARIHGNIHKCEEIVSQIMKQLAGGEDVSQLASGQPDLNAAMLESKIKEFERAA
ncbi:hypothetical protein [Estrella lausannensis]|uniref:Uncharacterized protein n=1 Tax=Estrella lausannensis TaxID=483423 RepID=A0A0H5DTX6_9BACT|nr:hypothetical protein [Estrella lausannensis]CRX39344.1 hypothetical protein ELAC_2022 [Estrella lausannensis]